MNEKDFRKILKRHLNGTITEEEKLILKQFMEDLEFSNRNSRLPEDALKKLSIKKSIWKNIKTGVDKRSTGRTLWLYRAAAAAVVIGFVLGGYFFLASTSVEQPFVAPQDAVTLTLDDGTLKVIDQNTVAAVTDMEGNVLGRQNGSQLVYDSDNVSEELVFNTLSVPYGKTFEVHLSDGTHVYLNAGSSLRYPIKFLKGQNRQVYISGEAFLDVAKDVEHPFIVSADQLNVQVLGTQFNVSAYPEDSTTDVVLVEGSVNLYENVNNTDGEDGFMLQPGFKGSFDKSDKSLSKDKVATSLYTSWINGELIFRNMAFEKIVKKLERHYDVTITDEGTKLSGKLFNANFGDEPLDNVLAELKTNYGIDYEIIDFKHIKLK